MASQRSPGSRPAVAGRRPARRRGRLCRHRCGLRGRSAASRAGRPRPCDGGHPRTRPSRRCAPRPAGTATVRTPRRARRRLAVGPPQGCDDPVEAVLAQRRRGRQRRRQPPERPVERRHRGAGPAAGRSRWRTRGIRQPCRPTSDGCRTRRCVLDRDDVEPPAAHQRRAHVGIGEIRGPGGHPATLPTRLGGGVALGVHQGAHRHPRPGVDRHFLAQCIRARDARSSRIRSTMGAARRPRTRGSTRSR